MNKTTVNSKGFEIVGQVIFSKIAFRFDVWEVREIATGNCFESISRANSATDAGLSALEIGTLAAIESGTDYVTLCDLNNETDS